MVAPEYNDGTSTVLKNALDWASRGPVRVLAGKPVAVIGTSPGRTGARGGIKSVVRTVRRTGSEVPSHTVAVPFALQVFTDGLELADLHVRAEVAPVVAELADRARAARRGRRLRAYTRGRRGGVDTPFAPREDSLHTGCSRAVDVDEVEPHAGGWSHMGGSPDRRHRPTPPGVTGRPTSTLIREPNDGLRDVRSLPPIRRGRSDP
jgi:hypothetical protein